MPQKLGRFRLMSIVSSWENPHINQDLLEMTVSFRITKRDMFSLWVSNYNIECFL